MKIVISTVRIPFVSGGAEYLANNLQKALVQAGHEAEIVTMPFMDNPAYLLENHIVASRLMDITNGWGGHHDLCIGLKFPAYYMPHPNKVIWALHQHRAVYDLFDTEYSTVKNDESGCRIRQMVMNADNAYLPEAKRIYTIAGNVTERMKRYNGIGSIPLYHPCPDMESFWQGDYGDYILMPSRINATKRQKLAIEALSKTKSNIKLYLVGRADNPIVEQEIKKYVHTLHMESRVVFLDYVTQKEKFNLYANARAVIFIPYDEDYGYITLEAMASAKAIITARDSGGPLEFVLDHDSGMVVEPEAESIARVIDEFAESTDMSREMGEAAVRHLKEMNITWEHVVEELTKP